MLLPFSWINFFTYSLEDAVRSTTAQFVMDAQRDGYLGTEELTRWTRAGLRVGCAGVLLLLCASLATADFTGPVVSVLDGDTIEVLHSTPP